MPRIARKNLGTPFLHVMVQGVNKEYIFHNDEYIKRYLDIIEKYKQDYDFTIIAYCIMNNHAHFLVYTENIEDFGKFMQKVNLIYAQMYNREQKRCGVLFRNRYRTEAIYDIKYLINCIKYIHDNPVKAKIVKRCEEYKYSSYNSYINNTCKNKIMERLFGNNCDYKVLFENLYERRFMDIEEEANNVYEYIEEGIREFKKDNAIDIIDILSNRSILMKLIFFLKEDCNIKYVEIRDFFEIPRGTMDFLKIK